MRIPWYIHGNWKLDSTQLTTLTNDLLEVGVKEKNINIDQEKPVSVKDILTEYSKSEKSGNPYTFIQENYNQFKLTTIKDVEREGSNVGYLAITEIANDIKTATDERKAFVIRTAISVGFVILIFSFEFIKYFDFSILCCLLPRFDPTANMIFLACFTNIPSPISIPVSCFFCLSFIVLLFTFGNCNFNFCFTFFKI